MFVFHCRMERTVYTLLRTRESLMRNCKEFQIPIEWMLDNGIIGKVHHTMHQSIQNVNDKCAHESIVLLYYESN